MQRDIRIDHKLSLILGFMLDFNKSFMQQGPEGIVCENVKIDLRQSIVYDSM